MESLHFQNRLNMTMFTNIEKSFTTEQFKTAYPSDKFFVFEKSAISSFIDKNKQLEKANLIESDTIQKAADDLKSLKIVTINDGPGYIRNVFVKEKTQDDIQKANDDNDLEKSHVYEALNGYNNNIKFSKTGKQIKDQLELVIKSYETELPNLEKAIEDASENLTSVPTETVPEYWKGAVKDKIKCNYKIFSWNQTYFNPENNTSVMGEGGKSCDAPASKEEAIANSKYNEAVRNYVDALKDMAISRVYADNVVDKKSYDMTLEQISALGF